MAVFFGCGSSGYSTFGRNSGESVEDVPEEEQPAQDEEVTEQPAAQAESEQPAQDTATSKVPKSTTKRFTVKADTLSAHTRKKGNGDKTSISVRAAAPTKYYSVQIGAYRKKVNADRNYIITQKRFKLPMIRLYEGGIKMERICTGRFATKKEAEDFLKKIQEQYPKEYTEAWVCMFKK